MTDLTHLIWSHHEGRTSEGDKFSLDALMHGSGRIPAKAFGPASGDEFTYRVTFYLTIPKKVLPNPNEAFDFMCLDSAKRFAETVVCQSTPECLTGASRSKGKPAKTCQKVTD